MGQGLSIHFQQFHYFIKLNLIVINFMQQIFIYSRPNGVKIDLYQIRMSIKHNREKRFLSSTDHKRLM